MIIVRSARPENGYTIIRNDVLRDERLSYRARGILAYVLSHSDNWRTDAQSLAEHGKEGRQAIYAALRELKDAGYIEHRRSQDSAGRWTTETVVFDNPNHIPATPVAQAAPAEVKKATDPELTQASKLVAENWEKAMKGISAQPAIAVIRIIANALRNGVPADRLATALRQLAASKQTVTVNRLNESLNGAPMRGQLKADQSVDWNTLAATVNQTTGEIAI